MPLAPWAAGGRGARRRRSSACAPSASCRWCAPLDGRRLGNAAETFARAWYRALRPGQPEGDAYKTLAAGEGRGGPEGRSTASSPTGPSCAPAWRSPPPTGSTWRSCSTHEAALRRLRGRQRRAHRRGRLPAASGALRLRVRRGDGTLSHEGLYDFVERPMGNDAVVLVLWHRAADGSVAGALAPRAARALWFRDRGARRARTPRSSPASSRRARTTGRPSSARAAAEAHEEAGMRRRARRRRAPGPGQLPDGGHVRRALPLRRRRGARPERRGDAADRRLALRGGRDARVGRRSTRRSVAATTGDIVDLKTELALRRLRVQTWRSGPVSLAADRAAVRVRRLLSLAVGARRRVPALRRRSAVARRSRGARRGARRGGEARCRRKLYGEWFWLYLAGFIAATPVSYLVIGRSAGDWRCGVIVGARRRQRQRQALRAAQRALDAAPVRRSPPPPGAVDGRRRGAQAPARARRRSRGRRPAARARAARRASSKTRAAREGRLPSRRHRRHLRRHPRARRLGRTRPTSSASRCARRSCRSSRSAPATSPTLRVTVANKGVGPAHRQAT